MDDETLDQVQEGFAVLAMRMEDMSARLLSTLGNVQEAADTMNLLRSSLIDIDQQAKVILQILTLESDQGPKI